MRRWLNKRMGFLAFWLVGGLLVASGYNACAPTEFSSSSSSVLQDLQSTALILIDKDALYTNNDQVELTLESRHANEVYVTNDPTCASGGNWEIKPATRNWTLNLKNQEVTVYAKFRNTDEGVYSGCIHDAIIHDDIKPVVSLQSPSIITNENAPIFYFLAGDTLSGLEKTTCKWPGQIEQVCHMSSSNGKVAEGRHLVEVVATDRAGNVSDPVVQDLLVDRTKPTVTLLTVPPALGNSTGITITFLAQDGLSGVKAIECSWDAGASFTPCASPVNSVRPEGQHKFAVRATDRAGNVGDIVRHDFTIDLTVPTVTITSSPPDFSASKNAVFSFMGVDGSTPIADFSCSLDAGAYVACSSPKNYSGLSEGLHKFEVRGKDAVGNMSAPASRSWVIDTIGPVITFVQTPNSPTKNSTADYKYSISDSGTGVVKTECSLDSPSYQDCAGDAKTYTDLAAGTHTFKIKATDKAGNFTEKSHSFVIDNGKPTIQFTRTPTSPSNSASFRFEFLATDHIGIQRVECRLDAQSFANCDTLTQHLVSGLTDGEHRFGIRAVDTAGNLSTELVHNWRVDLTGPEIDYFENPPGLEIFTAEIKLGFTVVDEGSGVKSLTCKLDNSVVACASGTLLNLGRLNVGDHEFVITATDNAGNSVTDMKTIKIRSGILKNLVARITENRKVDILVVIDNSPSMALEQQNMGARFKNFTDKLQGLDWQVAIITTDVSGSGARKDGRLVALDGLPGQYILDSSMDQTLAQKVFADTIQMDPDGSADEQGMKASIRAIQRSRSGKSEDAPNRAFFRDGASLTIIVVSDSKESGSKTADSFQSFMNQTWPDGKPFLFHSIVIPQSDYTNPLFGWKHPNDPCYDYRESGLWDGRAYHLLSKRTGGIAGTACTEDYSGQLSNMGTATAELVKSITLNCQPIDANNDGAVNASDVTVTAPNGQKITDFTLNGTKLTFTNYLPVGDNAISFYCAE